MALLAKRQYPSGFLFQKEEVRPLPNLFGCELIEIGGSFNSRGDWSHAVTSAILYETKDLFIGSFFSTESAADCASDKRLASFVRFYLGWPFTIAAENFSCEGNLAWIECAHVQPWKIVNVNCQHVNVTVLQIKSFAPLPFNWVKLGSAGMVFIND